MVVKVFSVSKLWFVCVSIVSACLLFVFGWPCLPYPLSVHVVSDNVVVVGKATTQCTLVHACRLYNNHHLDVPCANKTICVAHPPSVDGQHSSRNCPKCWLCCCVAS